jgi:4-hydroxy-3-methylbut-2-en-1-yl diphosphate reductase
MTGGITAEDSVYRRGFGLKKEVAGELEQDYHSHLVTYLQEHEYELETDRVQIVLGREFGFCYGVERAVDYAYETRRKFPDRRLFLTTEIIHNPRVNSRLMEMGIEFLSGQYAYGTTIDELRPSDVVLLPAFGVSMAELEELRKTGCVIVDTTCGSVTNVWRRVERYAREGYTSVIHGKYNHEETLATSSRAESVPGAKYLVVRDLEEAEIVCDYIRNKGDKEKFLETFSHCHSGGFDPDYHLSKIGVANQTTMLSSDSLAIAKKIERAFEDRYGKQETGKRFLSFDTICSATQDRQDAVIEMTERDLDLTIVVGGFNSSNTGHLCEIASEHFPSYHIDDVGRIESASKIVHKKPMSDEVVETENWLPEGFCRVGFTAGASTPNLVVGKVIARVLELKGVNLEKILRLDSD